MEYVYAALLLHKLEQDVNEENVKKVVAATGVNVDEAKVKSLVASLKGVDIEKELESASLAVSSGPASSAGAQASDEGGEGKKGEEKDEEEEEKKDEAAAEGLGALFG